ncbi:hypothetical protein ACFX13_008834 [Malus domestica]|uniref:MD-2-related lipid-recognition domain-containing protein n=1 Tax=Malus domestica TaxID=3750 RepID=A0A498IGR4_MALDO|nr:hypothetical protein DVH24_005238 [Malus domestica]
MALQLKSIIPLIILIYLCLVAPLIHAKDVNYCDKKADYDVKVSAVVINLYPVASGKLASFSISATAGASISGGKLVIEVSYFGWHIHSETHDLCPRNILPCFNR